MRVQYNNSKISYSKVVLFYTLLIHSLLACSAHILAPAIDNSSDYDYCLKTYLPILLNYPEFNNSYPYTISLANHIKKRRIKVKAERVKETTKRSR